MDIEELLKKLNKTEYARNKCERKLIAFKVKNRKYFEYELNTRKDNSKFIKILIYSNEHCDYIEVGRINLSKNEWVKNNFSVEDILGDVKS